MPVEAPYPHEQLRDPDFEEKVRWICTRPGMYVVPGNFDSVCAYLCGYDDARGGGPLLGLKEWLVVRTNRGNNLRWDGLARLCIPDGHDEKERIRALGELIGEYLRVRYKLGITKIYYDYDKWLLRHQWYAGPLRKNRGPAGAP